MARKQDFIPLKSAPIIPAISKSSFILLKSRDFSRRRSIILSIPVITKGVKDFLQPILAALALTFPVMTSWSDEQRGALVVGVVYFFVYQATSYASRKASAFSKRTRNLQQALSLSLGVGLLAGTISGITYYAGYPALAVLFYIVIYLIENLRKPIAISETANQLDTDIMATVLSTASQFETLFSALFSAMLGILADHFGLGIALTSVSLLVLITAPLYVIHQAQQQ